MNNMMQMLKQLQSMQTKASAMQDKLAQTEIVGQAANGAVILRMMGDGTPVAVTIKPEAIDANDPEMLNDIVLTAWRDLCAQWNTLKTAEAQKLTGGMQLPAGMKLPF
jgi:nucleoid-associated protein EbfC